MRRLTAMICSLLFAGSALAADPCADPYCADESFGNSGRVTIEGNEIRYEAYMANGSGYMSRWPDNDVTATYEMHDDDRMSLTMANGRVFLLRRP